MKRIGAVVLTVFFALAMAQSFGGVGRNIADCLSRLGAQPLFISALGDDKLADTLLTACSHMVRKICRCSWCWMKGSCRQIFSRCTLRVGLSKAKVAGGAALPRTRMRSGD